jgi:hypothetical protein
MAEAHVQISVGLLPTAVALEVDLQRDLAKRMEKDWASDLSPDFHKEVCHSGLKLERRLMSSIATAKTQTATSW